MKFESSSEYMKSKDRIMAMGERCDSKTINMFVKFFPEADKDAEVLMLRKIIERKAKRRSVIIAIVCTVLILACISVALYCDITGLFYGSNDIVFSVDGVQYIASNAMRYNQYAIVNIPQKTGYDVVGIIDERTGESVFSENGQSLKPVSERELTDFDDMVLTVRYKPHTYTANVAAANGNAVSAAFEYTVEDYPDEVLPQPQHLDGYIFDGYYTDSNFKQPFSGNFLDYATDTPLILYPHYSLDGWTIRWDLQQGEWINENCLVEEYTILTDMPLPGASEVIREGYMLSGWMINGTRVDYFTPTVMEDVTISAFWEPVSYSIVYCVDGGVFANNLQQTYTIEDEFNLQSPKKQGYVFDGWFDESNKRIDVIKKGDYGDKHLKAKYTAIEYDIIYDCNGGINDILNPSTYTADDGTIRLKQPKREGYLFDGWYINGVKCETITALQYADVTLKAVWTPKTYTVTVNPNNGENKYSKKIRFGDAYVLNVPVKKGHAFNRYVIGEEQFCISGIYTFTSDISIFAEYTANTYTVTCVSENALVSTSDIVYGQLYQLDDPSFKFGYEFEKWHTKDGYSLPKIGIYEFEQDIIVYASFIKTLTVNLNYETEYRIDDTIDKVYIYGTYNGSNELIKDVSFKILQRSRDLILVLVNAGFKAPKDKTAIDCENFSYRLSIVNNGISHIEGGNGTSGQNGVDGGAMSVANKDGENGKPGMHTINCGIVIFEEISGSDSELTIKSGNGGDGGRGGIDYDRSRMWLNFIPDAGKGGDVFATLNCTEYSINNTTVNILQGMPGSGGTAGFRGTWWGYIYGLAGKQGIAHPAISFR